MKKILIVLTVCIIGIYSSLDAQKVPRKLVSVTGTAQVAGGYYLSWSLGEPVVSTTSRDEYTLTQGFQQPSLINKEIPYRPDIDEIRVYPNPVRDELTLQFDVKHIHSYRVELFSLEGRVLLIKDIRFEKNLNSIEKEIIDFTGFSQGLYMVRIFSDDQRIDRLFKIEKINIRK